MGFNINGSNAFSVAACSISVALSSSASIRTVSRNTSSEVDLSRSDPEGCTSRGHAASDAPSPRLVAPDTLFSVAATPPPLGHAARAVGLSRRLFLLTLSCATFYFFLLFFCLPYLSPLLPLSSSSLQLPLLHRSSPGCLFSIPLVCLRASARLHSTTKRASSLFSAASFCFAVTVAKSAPHPPCVSASEQRAWRATLNLLALQILTLACGAVLTAATGELVAGLPPEVAQLRLRRPPLPSASRRACQSITRPAARAPHPIYIYIYDSAQRSPAPPRTEYNMKQCNIQYNITI